jgi:ribosomal protein S18 acetylase RimI-like enzyme
LGARAASNSGDTGKGFGYGQRMLTALHGLTDADLAAIAGLEGRVVAHDGGRLKLEWGVLRTRSGNQVDDLMWRDGNRALGFLGFYSFGGADLELTGMVDPVARREGIGDALLAAAIPIARERGWSKALLVTPRSSPAGKAFALAHGAVLEHSEHHLSLGPTPPAAAHDVHVALRPAADADTAEVSRILATAFGSEHPTPVQADGEDEQTYVIAREAVTVGTVRVSRQGTSAGIYGFAVDPPLQGKGIGRAVLNQLCTQLRADACEHVTIEVEVDNERALDLYLSVGFEPRTTEDYYSLTFEGTPTG